MDIWITWCTREAKCAHCPHKLQKGEPMVVGKMWRTQAGSTKKFVRMFRWHPQCYIEQGLIYLEQHPYVSPGSRGRKKLQLSPEDARQRRLLIMRRNTYVQRLRAAVEDNDVNEVLRLYDLMDKVKTEITNYGGVPDTWKTETS